jgi:hypothetical protein
MKQRMRQWAGVGLMAVAIMSAGVLSTTSLVSSLPAPQVLMADGGGDRPAPPPCPKGKCVSGETIA